MSAETMEFKTELKQLLHLIIHSLYSHKDIFLRELISNASDANDAVRFEALTNQSVTEDNDKWKIKLIADTENNTLTISDNGIGMNMETVVENLGTIARSGTKAFLEALKQADSSDRPDMIGQFGVGFYSSFMVADKVSVVSRMAGPKENGVRWESDGQGSYSVEQIEKDTRGTDVTLHLKDEDKDFLEPYRLRSIVKKYSDFIEHPIVMDVEKEEEEGKKTIEEETLNAQKAIWLRPKNEIKEEEYNEFYKHISHDYSEPLKTVHYKAEGVIEFKAIPYIPGHKPFDMMYGDSKKGLQLYIQRVFIMDDCEAMLPPYLRFMRGVVDSPDLPLNVSREILQQSAPLEKIKSNLTTKVLNTFDEMKRKEYDKYVQFYGELGGILKEGVSQDFKNKEKLSDLLLFESTKTEAGIYTTLQKYVDGMSADQEDIWYLAGESRELIENSPALEGLKEKGQEVLLLTDPFDDFVIQSLSEYKGKKLKAADKGEISKEEIEDSLKEKYKDLLTIFQEKIGELKEVRLSNRLKSSAVCLVSDEHEMGAHMERLMQRMGRANEMPKAQRTLEVNPNHPTIEAIQKVLEKDKTDPRLDVYCKLLYDQALIGEGSKIRDGSQFAQRINELLVRDAAG